MGMLYSWLVKVTTPLRDLTRTLTRFKGQMAWKLFSYQKMQKGLVNDVRRLAQQAAMDQDTKASKNAAPKAAPQKAAPPKNAPQRAPPRRR